MRTSEARASSVRLLLSWIRAAAAVAVLMLSLTRLPHHPPLAFTPSYGSVGASLWGHSDVQALEHPILLPLFSVAATSERRSPSLEALSHARGGLEEESPMTQRRAAHLSPIAPAEAFRRAVPIRAPVHSSIASVHRPERIESLSESLLTNVAFERSLRAASASSGGLSGQDLLSYPPSAGLFSVPADLPTFSYRALPVKLGRARLTALFGSPDSRGREDAATVKTSLVVPAFHKSVTLNLGGGYDHLHRPETTILPYYPYDASSSAVDDGADIAAAGSASAVKGADAERYTYGAGAAVPVAHDLHLGIGYTAQRLSGTYGVAPNALPVNRKDAYSGSLTFAPHGGKSTLSIIGGQSRYSDDAAPNAAYTERRGDVVFSVKF